MTTPERLDPGALAGFSRLELIARLVVEGVTAGLHQSPFKGFSVEFAEHRQYGPGDEIRHIDWRAFGKTDRYFVKEFEEQTNLTAYLVVDSSGGMGYSGSGGWPSKLEQARGLAASLAYLMLTQRDAVGLALSDSADNPETVIPPRTTPGHLTILCEALEAAQPRGETPLSRVLHSLAERIRHRGLIVVLSDGFEAIEPLTLSFRHLRHRHHEVLFLQTLSPDEETFPFHHATSFRDLNGSSSILSPRGHPDEIRTAYLARFRQFCQELETSLHAMGASYHKVSTAVSVERIVLDILSSRSRRARASVGTRPEQDG